MKKFILGTTLCVLALTASPLAYAQEATTTTTNQAALQAQIESLMKLIATLQSQIAAARGEIKDLARDLKLGEQSDDVKEVQELLASDPELFGVKPTGYYGPLTEAAIKKFQERYGLPVTGIVDEATREVMRELKMERKNGLVPPGLVKSDEVKNRIKDRLKECDFERAFRSGVCEKVKDKYSDDKNTDDDSDEDDTTVVTRDDARRAVVDAQNALNTFRDSVDDMGDEDADEAVDTLRDAQKEMIKARRALTRNNFEDAHEAAEEVLEIISGDDDSDDEDEDNDSDDDEDND